VPGVAPSLSATLHLPLASGEVAATADGWGAAVAAVGTYDPLGHTVDVSVRIRNDAGIILFNPKLVVTSLGGGVAVSRDGTLDGRPYFYFGPTGIGPGAWSRAVTMHFTGVTAPADVSLRLRTDPLVLLWGTDGAPFAIDPGTNENRGRFASTTGSQSAAMSPLARHVAAVDRWTSDLQVLDLAEDSAFLRTIAPVPGEPGSRLFGVAFSRDGGSLWVACGSQSTNGWIPFLAKLETTGFAEVARVTFPESASPLYGTIALDAKEARAFLPSETGGTVWIADLEAMTVVDADGDAGNGPTPLTLTRAVIGPEESLLRAAVVEGGRLYVGYGGPSRTNEIAVVDTTDLVQLAPLLSSSPSVWGSGTRMLIGPDGKLWVPRASYASQPGDPDSWGISVFDPASTSTTESARVSVVGSYAAGNDDVWEVVFVPGRSVAYGLMTDVGMLFPFDWQTRLPIDADGDASNGQTNIATGADAFFATLLVTPY
jgi:hypothetical protein